jgi:hypothetical protein
MKRTLAYCLAIAVLLVIGVFVPSAATLGQDQRLPNGPDRVYQGAEPHPNINAAISALEAARADLQDAAHDYCGHRVEALEATNGALNQLGAAIACEERRGASAGATLTPGSDAAPGATAGERHPLMRAAVNALRAARKDLQNAAQVYCGHRVEALEATNSALNQLERARRCDRD